MFFYIGEPALLLEKAEVMDRIKTPDQWKGKPANLEKQIGEALFVLPKPAFCFRRLWIVLRGLAARCVYFLSSQRNPAIWAGVCATHLALLQSSSSCLENPNP